MSTPDPKQPALPATRVDFYDSTYGRFDESPYREIRQQTWQEDFGQNGWITAHEQDQFIAWLGVGPGMRLLDVGCGSGGPSLRVARQSGATVIGVDIHPDGISAARQASARGGLAALASFQVLDAQQPLPFGDEWFDAITCIDAINHLADRSRVLGEWSRVLKPGGRLLFTDPAVVTGTLSSEEIAVRSSIGFFLFVAPDTDERMIADAGLRLMRTADVSEVLARIATKWRAVRDQRAAELKRIEGAATFEGQQRFLEVAARLAAERRLSRFAYLACKV